MRQFVAVRFAEGDKRTYTYHNDGPAVAPGDEVRVSAGKGERLVKVAEITFAALPFATKPILGAKPRTLL